jgi:hypothetical protein
VTDTAAMWKSKRAAGAFLIAGCLLAATGFIQDRHSPDFVLVVPGIALASAGLLQFRRRSQNATASPHGLALVGAVFAAGGLGFTVAPFVELGLGHWSLAAITFAGLIIGPYFTFLGYVMLWGGIVGTDAPFAKPLGRFMRRAVGRLVRPV